MQKLPAKPLDSQINVADSSDVRYWCRKLGCAQSDLLAAVKVLGPVALDVATYVKRREQLATFCRHAGAPAKVAMGAAGCAGYAVC